MATAAKHKHPPMTQENRKMMVTFISKPLTVYLRTSVQKNFDQPLTAESLDVVAEAISKALHTTFGTTSMGIAGLKTLALNLLDNSKGK